MDVVVAVWGVVDIRGQWRWGEFVEEVLEGAEGGGGGVIGGLRVDVLGEAGVCEERECGGECAAEGALEGAEVAAQ